MRRTSRFALIVLVLGFLGPNSRPVSADIACATCPHALIVGVTKYFRLPAEWRLPEGDRLSDLKALANALGAPTAPSTLQNLVGATPDDKLAPTRAAIEAGFARLAQLDWSRRAIVILSGRVARSPAHGPVFLPADASRMANPDLGRFNSEVGFAEQITSSQISAWLSSLRAQTLVIVETTGEPGHTGPVDPFIPDIVRPNVIVFEAAAQPDGASAAPGLIQRFLTVLKNLRPTQEPAATPTSAAIGHRLAAVAPSASGQPFEVRVIGPLRDRPFLAPGVRPALFKNATSGGVNCDARDGHVPRTRALLLGIGTFSDQGLRDLEGTSNDVSIVRNALMGRGVAADDISALAGRVTRADVLAALDNFIAAARCGDRVFLHFSGTGHRLNFAPSDEVPTDGANELGLATSDSTLPSANDSPKGWIRASEFALAVTALRNKGAFPIVAIDGCGAAGLDLAGRAREGLWRWMPFGESDATSLFALSPGAAGFAALYASAEDAFAMETKLPLGARDAQTYGVFSFALAGAMSNPAVQSVRELAAAITTFYRQSDMVSQQRSRPGFEGTDPDQPLFGSAPTTRGIAIELLEPEPVRGVRRVTAAQTRVSGRVVPSTDLMSVFVNYRSAALTSEGRFSIELPLSPGLNQITVQGMTRTNLTAVDSFTVENAAPGAAGRPRRAVALIIANEAYGDPSRQRRLQTPIRDAVALADILRTRYGFETELAMPSGDKLPLILQNAGRRQIMTAINSMRLLTEDDALLIYYAGHGWRSDQADQAFWIPVDAEYDNFGDYISSAEITTAIKMLNVRHLLLISDSCYAGALTRDGPDGPSPAQQRYLEAVALKRSRVLISSGSVEPVLDGGGSGHSVFARALLDQLRTETREAFSAEQLFPRIKEYVAGNSNQTPQYQIIRAGHDGGDFVFFRRAP
jgi:hypothetical protein